ncbi:S24 family peptidase [Ruminiclostridium herbifermentans]|uniref:S24 family peptidase n=1 Tax=Ruminiclostridium herbifermentans TaxID=2488810 RepID=A0A4U7JKB0_9FIRM|nr:S24 family peptidase [Ruminiclostridium herbifermentans]QNU65347.1 S24 family peptidase [Ruminiclostridium herbifermentans]
MIYNKSILIKELTESYFDHSISNKRRLGYALFLALVSFAFHYILRTLEKSVLSDAVPKYMSPSCFSTLFIYVDLFYLFIVSYLATNYNFLTFDEIRNNKWYIPIKFGFSPIKMILTKLYARLITITFIYGFGFLLMLFLTTLLKYPLVFEYIIPIFALGLIDFIFIMIVSMTASLYFKKGIISNYALLFSVISIIVLKRYLGYYSLINDISNFQNIYILSKFSKYFSILIFASIICILIIITKGITNAEYYNFSLYEMDYDIPDDVIITMQPDSEFKRTITHIIDPNKRLRILTRILNSLLFILILSFIIVNVIVLVISISTARKEVAIFRVIPYVFQSESMYPAIMYNDLVFFEKTNDIKVSIGDIVIYESNGEASIARVQLSQAGKVTVSIDNHPSESEGRVYSETININQIYGKYIGKSRWLGLLILFANSTIGRLTLLLIPIILLFYYKPIVAMLRYIINNGMNEE